jgi:hypothetical protein
MTKTTKQRPERDGSARGSGWSPMMSGSSYDREEDEWWREREVGMIERALAENGVLQRRDLGRLIGCRYWGPGRFRRALQAAVDRGRAKRVGFGRYALSDEALDEHASA